MRLSFLLECVCLAASSFVVFSIFNGLLFHVLTAVSDFIYIRVASRVACFKDCPGWLPAVLKDECAETSVSVYAPAHRLLSTTCGHRCLSQPISAASTMAPSAPADLSVLRVQEDSRPETLGESCDRLLVYDRGLLWCARSSGGV